MKLDQDLCGTSDMNSILGSFVPLAMFKTLLRAPILNFGLIHRPDCLSRTYDKAFSDILIGNTDWTDELRHFWKTSVCQSVSETVRGLFDRCLGIQKRCPRLREGVKKNLAKFRT